MRWMFSSAEAFNSSISYWDVSKMTNMNGIVFYAGALNSDISGWNTSNVSYMDYKFCNAEAFVATFLAGTSVKCQV